MIFLKCKGFLSLYELTHQELSLCMRRDGIQINYSMWMINDITARYWIFSTAALQTSSLCMWAYFWTSYHFACILPCINITLFISIMYSIPSSLEGQHTPWFSWRERMHLSRCTGIFILIVTESID